MEQAYDVFFAVLRGQLTGNVTQYPGSADWHTVALLAKVHSLQAMVYRGVRDIPGVPQDVLEELAKGYHNTVFRDAQFDYAWQQISRRLSAARAQHIFLRGICLKHDYPIPALRSMSDIDILVHTADYAVIHEVMDSLGACLTGKDDNHRSYRFPTGVLVEFHPNLLRHDSVAARLNPGWQFAVQDSEAFELQMTEEGFYLNVAGHMAHHFFGGGTGVRSVMDIWVCRNLRKAQPDRAFVEKELNKCGLLSFVKNIEALAEAWFGDGVLTPELEELGMYILTSGTYGTTQRLLLSTVSRSGGSKWMSMRKKLFPTRLMLEDEYLWCKGRGYLLPVAWAVRLLKKTTRRGGVLVRRWGRDNLSLPAQDIAEHSEKLRRFGLDKDDR